MVQDLFAKNGKVYNSTLLLFDQAKREEFTIYNGFRLLHKHVRNSWHVDVNNDELTDATFDKCRIFVLPSPRAKFYVEEFDALRKFIKSGGSLLVTLGEGGEPKADTNINFLLEEFGIACNPDCVIRTVYYKYFDPKEALISNGIINRSIGVAAGVAAELPDEGGFSRNERLEASSNFDDINNNQTALSLVYPFGATLNVNRNSVAVLSTGTVCYPISRPICAFHSVEGGGRVVVIGSTHMFADDYFEKEQNSKIFDVIIRYLSEGIELNPIDAADPELADAHPIPDHIELSNQLKMCLQESEVEQTIFGDFTKLFDQTLCSIGLEHWAETMRCYDKLGLKHEPLSLVSPVFEVPQPPLQPAVFPPNFREISPPKLELFDLDDAFSSHEVRLAQLTNRCAENDLDLFVREAGELLGVSRMLAVNERSSKKILEHVLHQIVEYKKEGQDLDMPPAYIKEEENDQHIFVGAGNEEEHYFSDIDEYDDI